MNNNIYDYSDNEILNEGLSDIFGKIKKAPVDFMKINKAKTMLAREYNVNIDKHINKYKSDLTEISSLAKTVNIDNEKSVKLFEENATKKFLKFLPNLIKEVTDDLAENLEKIYNDLDLTEDNNSLYAKLLKSCMCTMIPSLINSIFLILFSLIFGSLGAGLTASCIAPLTEELTKLTADKYVGSSKHGISIYNVVFNINEFTQYFIKLFVSFSCVYPNKKKSDIVKSVVMLRIPAIIMHTVNTGIIKLGRKKNEEIGGETAVLATILIHSCFNALASFKFDFETVANKLPMFKDEVLHEGFIFGNKEKLTLGDHLKPKNPSKAKSIVKKAAMFYLQNLAKKGFDDSDLKITQSEYGYTIHVINKSKGKLLISAFNSYSVNAIKAVSIYSGTEIQHIDLLENTLINVKKPKDKDCITLSWLCDMNTLSSNKYYQMPYVMLFLKWQGVSTCAKLNMYENGLSIGVANGSFSSVYQRAISLF